MLVYERHICARYSFDETQLGSLRSPFVDPLGLVFGSSFVLDSVVSIPYDLRRKVPSDTLSIVLGYHFTKQENIQCRQAGIIPIRHSFHRVAIRSSIDRSPDHSLDSVSIIRPGSLLMLFCIAAAVRAWNI